jgi:putative transposase
MHAVREARDSLACIDACAALEVPRASYYRWEAALVRGTPASDDHTGPCEGSAPRVAAQQRGVRSHRGLSSAQRTNVLDVLHEPRFVDLAVPQVWARLLDEGVYLCSRRTMYRILDGRSEVRERRDQLRRPAYVKPELLATAPNQVWSWDITKLRGPVKWTYFYLYVILDIFSRYAVGWMIASRESALLAKKLWAETVRKHEIPPGQLIGHSDHGAPMTAKAFALLLADLGITQSFSRPHVSDDNPFSEAQFKTIKYRPDYPDRFGSIEDARAYCVRLFDWYHHQHRHSSHHQLARQPQPRPPPPPAPAPRLPPSRPSPAQRHQHSSTLAL